MRWPASRSSAGPASWCHRSTSARTSAPPVNHQTGRQLSLDFRAATALFGDFGVEWDISQATAGERARLAELDRAVQAAPRPAARRPDGPARHRRAAALDPRRAGAGPVRGDARLRPAGRGGARPGAVPGDRAWTRRGSYLARRDRRRRSRPSTPSIAGYRWRRRRAAAVRGGAGRGRAAGTATAGRRARCWSTCRRCDAGTVTTIGHPRHLRQWPYLRDPKA